MATIVPETPQEYQRKKHIFRAYQGIWYVLGVIEVLLGFRFILRLLGANPASGFTDFIYSVSAPFAVPFLGILPVSRAGDTALEWSTLIAMAVYLVIAWGLVKLFRFAKPADPVEVKQTVDTEV